MSYSVHINLYHIEHSLVEQDKLIIVWTGVVFIRKSDKEKYDIDYRNETKRNNGTTVTSRGDYRNLRFLLSLQ